MPLDRTMVLAYIDPGFGALIWQALFAALVGSIFFLRSTFTAAFQWVRGRFVRGEKSISTDPR